MHVRTIKAPEDRNRPSPTWSPRAWPMQTLLLMCTVLNACQAQAGPGQVNRALQYKGAINKEAGLQKSLSGCSLQQLLVAQIFILIFDFFFFF